MKTFCKISVLFFLICFCQFNLVGQENIDKQANKKLNHALGIGAGFTTGYGLSYRFVPKKFGVQFTFAPFKNENTTQFSAGMTFLYKVIETDIVNFLIYQANHYYYRKEKYTNYYNPQYYRENLDNHFNNGIGIGIEFIILKRVSFNIMGGYGAYRNFEQIGLTGETGLYFKL